MSTRNLREKFRKTFSERSGFRSDYKGSHGFSGPAVVCNRDDLQVVIDESPVSVVWDEVCGDLIVFPE